MDTIGKPLKKVCQQLLGLNRAFKISVTRPISKHFAIDYKQLYVVKQYIDKNGTYNLTVAYKMGKEVR